MDEMESAQDSSPMKPAEKEFSARIGSLPGMIYPVQQVLCTAIFSSELAHRQRGYV
jgi:hypothetical protein